MPTIGQDTFLTGSRGTGTPGAWNPASDGQAWSQDIGTTTTDFTGTQGRLSGASANTIMLLGAKTSADIDVLCRCQNTANTDIIGVVGRATASTTYYFASLVSGNFHIQKSLAGVQTELTGSPVAFTEVATTLYWIRLRCQGTAISGKVWADGSSEPTSWTLALTDSSISGAGQFGVRGKPANSTNHVAFDSFLATSIITGIPLGGTVRRSHGRRR